MQLKDPLAINKVKRAKNLAGARRSILFACPVFFEDALDDGDCAQAFRGLDLAGLIWLDSDIFSNQLTRHFNCRDAKCLSTRRIRECKASNTMIVDYFFKAYLRSTPRRKICFKQMALQTWQEWLLQVNVAPACRNVRTIFGDESPRHFRDRKRNDSSKLKIVEHVHHGQQRR